MVPRLNNGVFPVSYPQRVERWKRDSFEWVPWVKGTWFFFFFGWIENWVRERLTERCGVYTDEYTVETCTFDSIREAIYKSKRAMEDIWGERGTRVIMNHEYYEKLCVEVQIGMPTKVFALDVILCPWYQGEICVF